MRLIAFALLLTATPALAAEQYDLSCQGTKVTKSGGPAEATSLKLRVDLTARKWCLDDCKSVEDIYELSADKVVLQDDVTYNTRTDLQDKITVDRKTLAFSRMADQTRPEPSYLKVEAKCTEQPFTPFPKAGA